MTIRRLLAGAIIAQALIVLGGAPALANQILTYTGNSFAAVLAPYTTSNKITGTLNIATPLGVSISDAVVAPASYSFSDGVQTLTETNSTITSLLISTDALGQVSGWQIMITSSAVAGAYIQTCSRSGSCLGIPGLTFDFGISAGVGTRVTSLRCPSTITTFTGGSGGGNVCTPGIWTSTVVTAVPEPAGIGLLALALGAVAPLVRRRRRG